MSTLVFHCGFPKAASTSLQNGILLSLHKSGLINFVGRAFENDFFGAHASRQEFNKWLNGLVEESPPCAGAFASQERAVNVLSDNSYVLRKFVYGEDLALNRFTEKAKAVFSEVSLVFVIRRQADLVRSNFIQRYQNIEEKNFSSFVAKGLEGQIKEFGMYRFADVFEAFRREMDGVSVKILFFEDYLHDKPRFALELGRALGVGPEAIADLLGDTHLNARRKTSDHDIVSKTKHMRGVRQRAARLTKRLGLSGLDQLLAEKISKMTEQQAADITDHFRASNEELCERFDLERSRMQRYGYI